jgi:hypothetical protein
MTGVSRYDAGTWVGAKEMPMDVFLDHAQDWAERLWRADVHGVIACEDFRITMNTAKKAQGDRQWSLEQIGVLRWLARRYDHVFELTGASEAKRFSTNEKLRNAGWWTKGGGGHHNDATRQVMIALARRGVLVGMS